ncbi:calnexin-like [Prorops nasuta]|uniref:calnexin-like n=1 Tax=Prorops nasuta TaxID=863751 RepID=UPI0034CEBCF3
MAQIITYVTFICLTIFSIGLYANDDQKINIDEETKTVKPSYKSPIVSGFAYLTEDFDNEERFKNNWILSEAKKEGIDADIAKYDGVWAVEPPKLHAQAGDLGLVLKSKARHAAISTLLTKPIFFEDDPIVIQYEVNFQEGQECGGAYLKLLTLDQEDLKKFHDKTPYTIMFGPDKCGNDHHLHFIFRHKNPLNGTIEEKHAKKPKERLEDFFKDKQPHLYTLILRPDNTFEIKVDNKIVNSGSLLDDFTPPVNPSLEIEDPHDVMPEDWDDREKIPDPLAVKPDDWDEDAPAQIIDEDDKMPDGWLEHEPPMIPNPESIKPDDWDVEMDGEWEPPSTPNPVCADAPGCGPYQQKMKKNPKYKGKWLPPLVNNPNYKGKWKPKLIHNPNYFNDEHPFRMMPIYAIGFELWSMSPDIQFDNIIITNNVQVAKKWADETFEAKRLKIAEETWSVWRQVATFTAENPWIWAVYTLAAGIPVILLVYCCCFPSEDKEKEEYNYEEKDLLNTLDGDENLTNEGIENEAEDSNENAETNADIDEEAEKDSESEEASNLESTKDDVPLAGGDGPRRRKPNKE